MVCNGKLPLPNRPEQAKARLAGAAALFLAIAFPSGVNSHGAHAVFLSPGHSEVVTGELRVHVADPGVPLPYLKVEVLKRQRDNSDLAQAFDPIPDKAPRRDASVWTGLLSRESLGYETTIDVRSWSAGQYRIEVQFVGDIVEDIYMQPFAIKSVSSGRD